MSKCTESVDAMRSVIQDQAERIAELETALESVNMHGETCAHELEDANKRIAELEKELESFNAEHSLHCKIIPSLEAHNLEQQAKGVEDAADKTKAPYGRNGLGFIIYMCPRNTLLDYGDELRNQAKVLRGE